VAEARGRGSSGREMPHSDRKQVLKLLSKLYLGQVVVATIFGVGHGVALDFLVPTGMSCSSVCHRLRNLPFPGLHRSSVRKLCTSSGLQHNTLG